MKTNPILDELAYSLYISQTRRMSIIASKNYFIAYKNKYNEYYIKATNIIRREKLKKIQRAR